VRRKLTLGTRPGQLARKQTDVVAAGLPAAWPRLQTEVEVYITWGNWYTSLPWFMICAITEARRYTQRDSPLFTAIYHTAEETLALWERPS